MKGQSHLALIYHKEELQKLLKSLKFSVQKEITFSEYFYFDTGKSRGS